MTWRNALRILGGVLLMGMLAMSAGADVWDDAWDDAWDASGALTATTGHSHSSQFLNPHQSLNWAGEISTGATFSRVSAEWVQPFVSCGTPDYKAVGIWVGLDGVKKNDRFVEQVGTQVECSNGQPTTYGFWETYPTNSAQNASGFTVKPFDHLAASVVADESSYTVTIRNLTDGTSFTKTVTNPGATGGSAEVIVERPSTCATGGCHAPLANFSPVLFHNLAGLSEGNPDTANMVSGVHGHNLATTYAWGKELAVTWNASN